MCQKALANFIVNCPGRLVRAKDSYSCFRGEVVLFGCCSEVEPRDGAVRPRRLAEPVERGIAGRKLQHLGGSIQGMTKKQRASWNNHENSSSFPRKNLEEFFEPSLGGITDRNPPVTGNELLMITNYRLSSPISLSLLQNGVADKERNWNKDDRQKGYQNDQRKDRLCVLVVHIF